MGAGAIGCYLGGRLAAADVDVHFVGRARVLAALREHGMTVSDLDGAREHLPPSVLRLHERVPEGLRPSLVLLSVKTGATRDAAAEIAATVPGDTLVVSMQNGVSNAAVAQAAAPNLRVRPGMVPYNVAQVGPGHYHRGTGGVLAAQDDGALREWMPVFERAGLPLKLHADLRPIQWGKLLINLNNPVNALSGRPLREQLLQRGYRRCVAALIEEGLALLQSAGITPAQVLAVAPHTLVKLFRLPSPLFRIVAARMLRIDPKARSSMADDVVRGAPTEIDALCGEIVRLAQSIGKDAPRNARMVQLMQRPRVYAPQELAAALGI